MKTLQVVFMVIALTHMTLSRSASKSKFSLHELALLKQITGIGDKFTEYWVKNSQCISNIIGDSEVKPVWDDIKSQIDDLVKVEWLESTTLTDIDERQKSKVAVVEKGVDVIEMLVSQLVDKSMLDLLNKMTAAECWEQYDLFDDLEHFESFTEPNKFQCLVDVVGKVSESNRLKSSWSKVKPDLQQHLDKQRSCSNAGNLFNVNQLCNLKEGITTYKILTEYLHAAAVQKPQFIHRLASEVVEGCSSYQFLFFVEAHEVENADTIIKILRCHSEAISDAVKLSYSASSWKYYQKRLYVAYKQIKACDYKLDTWEATKCIAKEAQRASEYIGKFMDGLQRDEIAYENGRQNVESGQEAYDLFVLKASKLTAIDIKDKVQEKCHSGNGFFRSILGGLF